MAGSSICWSIVQLIIVLYLLTLIWVLYMMQYPTECVYAKRYGNKKDSVQREQQRKFSNEAKIATMKNYRRRCLLSMWHENQNVSISLYIGVNGKRPSKAAKPVWVQTTHNVDLGFKKNLNITIPNKVKSNTTQSIEAWLHFDFLDLYQAIDNPVPSLDVPEETRLTYYFPIAVMKDHIKRDQRYNLLNGTNIENSVDPNRNDNKDHDEIIENNSAVRQRKTLHWKFKNHAIILRYAQNYRILGTPPRLDTIGLRLKHRKRSILYSRLNQEGTERVYEPMLWVDDQSHTRYHYTPVVWKKSSVSTNISTIGAAKSDTTAIVNDNNDETVSITIDVDGNIVHADTATTDATTTTTTTTGGRRKVPQKIDPHYSDWHEQITLEYRPTSLLYYSMKTMIDSYMDNFGDELGLREEDLDELRYWLSEKNLFRLLVTQFITWAHITLQYLAFADEWKFYRGKKSFGGISITSLLFSVFRSMVLFAYLYDENSSWIILGSVAKDTVYDSWKIIKVKRLSIKWITWSQFTNCEERKSDREGQQQHQRLQIGGFIPTIVTQSRKSQVSEAEIVLPKEVTTAECDAVCQVWGMRLLGPAILAIAIYSLADHEHKSWWSWLMNSLVDAVYAFGFVRLLPQLYINYKFKSIAHLPTRAFLYKVFETFIDDAFAFVVDMPWKHRLMTFRDDFVFLIFLYQWWIYPVDMSRRNEYGFQYAEDKDQEQDQDQDHKYENNNDREKEKEKNVQEVNKNDDDYDNNDDNNNVDINEVKVEQVE